MSPRYPSTDPRVIRAALDYARSHSYLATAKHFGVNDHSIPRWIQYRLENGPSWPTDADIAAWDAKAAQRAELRRFQRNYTYRLHRNGGQRLMQPSHGTIRRLQALCAIGWTHAGLGARLGVTGSRVSHIIRNTKTGVKPETARKVARLYDELWDVVPVGRIANRVRAESARKGWVSPLAWDDDELDDPDAKPRGVHGERDYGFDEALVLARIAGDRTAKTRGPENVEVVRRMLAAGWTQSGIRRHTGLKVERYINQASVRRAA